MLKSITIFIISLLITLNLHSQSKKPAEPVSSNSLTRSFVCEEINYPKTELQKGTEGTVVLKFIVAKDGAVSNIRIMESVSDALDREAIRVFRMIEWKPAVNYGSPIVSEAEFSFPFNIKKYNKKCKQRGYDSIEYPYLPVDTTYTVYPIADLDKNPHPDFGEERTNFAIFVQQNLEYPANAYKQGISGNVTLEFIVETHGRVSNITIKNSIGGGCNEEAIRILKLLKWLPGQKDGVAVRCRMAIDISFKLSSDSEHRMYDYQTGSSI